MATKMVYNRNFLVKLLSTLERVKASPCRIQVFAEMLQSGFLKTIYK